jgi:hypothetical protein
MANSMGLPAVYLMFLASSGIVVSSRSRSFRRHLRKLVRFVMQPQPDEFPTGAILSPSPALVDFQPGHGREHAGSAGPLPIFFGASSSFEFSFGSTLPKSPTVTTALAGSLGHRLRQRLNFTNLDVPPPLPPPRLIPIQGPQNPAEYTDVAHSPPAGYHYLHKTAQLIHDHVEKPYLWMRALSAGTPLSPIIEHEGPHAANPVHDEHDWTAPDISPAPSTTVTGTIRARGRKRKTDVQEGEEPTMLATSPGSPMSRTPPAASIARPPRLPIPAATWATVSTTSSRSRSSSIEPAAAESPRLAGHDPNPELVPWLEQQQSIQPLVRRATEPAGVAGHKWNAEELDTWLKQQEFIIRGAGERFALTAVSHETE